MWIISSIVFVLFFFFSSRRRHTRSTRDWSSDVCSSDLVRIGAALAVPGVYAVLTHTDLPGPNRYGLEIADQPVLAEDVVRYAGEPVALVAADHPETARRAAARIEVDYEVLPPLTDPEEAVAGGGPELHPGGNLVRHLRIRHGDPDSAGADV